MKSPILASAASWRTGLLALVLGAACLGGHQRALAQAGPVPPERMTYQGYLVDGNGDALGGIATGPKNYDVVFRIWSTESGTSNAERLWTEQQTVTVDKGYFSVLLGEGTAVGGEPRPALSTLFKGATASDRFVEVTVKGIAAGGQDARILPRLRLLASPYAYLATQATKLIRTDNSADLLSSSANTLSLNGDLDIANNFTLEFGVGLNKEANAGKIGYATFTPGALDIVGAGTPLGNNRAVKIWAEAGTTFTGPVNATSFNGPHTGDGSGLSGVAKLGANTFTAGQDIQGHVRVGAVPGTVGSAGWGNAVVYSGAAPVAAGYNGDNSDPLWMARYNTAANESELRVVIGDDPGSTGDRFVVGTMQGNGNFSQTASWAAKATIDARGYLGLAGRGADAPLAFPSLLGSKICLWGDAGTSHYGLGIQNSTLQIFSDTFSSGVAFGYGSSGAFNETARINGDALFVKHASHPQLQLNRPDGRYAQFFRDGSAIYLTLNLSHHDAGHRYALYNGDANWDFGSDRKLKKDIVDAQPVLERALQVRVRNFRWKESPTNSAPMIGVIAQELQPLFPDMVNSFRDPQLNEDVLTVGYGDFAVIAIKALQELKAQQDAELKDLKAQVTELKSQLQGVLQAAAELREQTKTARSTAAVTK